jgi:hypothetical protein
MIETKCLMQYVVLHYTQLPAMLIEDNSAENNTSVEG